jgi:Ribosomal protein L36e
MLITVHIAFFVSQSLSKRTKMVRDLIGEVVGLSPYEKRLLDMLKTGGVSSEKRMYKFAKRRVRDHCTASILRRIIISWDFLAQNLLLSKLSPKTSEVDVSDRNYFTESAFLQQQSVFRRLFLIPVNVRIYVVGNTQESHQEERADQGDLRQDESTCCQLNWLTHQHTTVIN